MIDRTQTIATIVLDHSECAGIFKRHRIDFCCRGDVSLETAASEKGLDAEKLLKELSDAVASRQDEPSPDLRELSTPQLIEHIISTHHNYLREALPFIDGLASKVSRVHGDKNPKLRELAACVDGLAGALLPHLDDEEQSLFPALLDNEVDNAGITEQFGSMQTEHLAVADILEKVRAATEDFSLPAWACTSYRTLFSELAALESDVFSHVHLENHVLRPRFTA